MAFAAASWRQSVGRYSAVSRAYVRVGLALRFEFLVGLGATLLNTWILVSIWSVIRSGSSDVQAAFDAPDMATYMVVAGVVNFARMGHASRRVIYRSLRQVSTGQIAVELVRPVNMQLLRYAEWLGVFLVDALLVAVPTWLIFRLAGVVDDPSSGMSVALFALSIGLAWLVLAGLHFIVNAITLMSISGSGVTMARVAIQEFFGGALIPLALMPGALRVVADLLPFQAITSTPTLVYMDRLEGPELVRAFGVQVIWAIALFAIGMVVWRLLVRRVQIQGG
ncbi:MAG: ABC-2 family transporter protein [Chloroflexi bacterium]|nr:ABC-2 family transporter protein [Chloroflexota bacterium]